MLDIIDQLTVSKGVKRINSLSDIVARYSFFIDSNYTSGSHFAVYPVTKKANLTHDVLNLYGSHWRYIVDVRNRSTISKGKGDTAYVMRNLKEDKKKKKNAIYAFTQRYLDENRSLWLFVPNIDLWEPFQCAIAEKYRQDRKDYNSQKQRILKDIKSKTYFQVNR